MISGSSREVARFAFFAPTAILIKACLLAIMDRGKCFDVNCSAVIMEVLLRALSAAAKEREKEGWLVGVRGQVSFSDTITTQTSGGEPWVAARSRV